MGFTVFTQPALEVRVDGGTITNHGPATVYYADNNSVFMDANGDAQNAEDWLPVGQTAALGGSQWLVAGHVDDIPSRATVTITPSIASTDYPSTVGGLTSFDLIETAAGWPARPAGAQNGTWIGWTDPTDLMFEYDRFIAIPAPE